MAISLKSINAELPVWDITAHSYCKDDTFFINRYYLCRITLGATKISPKENDDGQCPSCGTATSLHVNGQPLCPSWDEKPESEPKEHKSKASLSPTLSN